MHLARVMKVLEAVATAGRPITASEVQQLTDLPRPTCYRLLQSMQAEQLLDEVSSGRFIVGESLVRLAILGQTDVDICRSAAPTLQRAAEQLVLLRSVACGYRRTSLRSQARAANPSASWTQRLQCVSRR